MYAIHMSSGRITDTSAVKLAIYLGGIRNFAWETAAIQYYSIVKHFEIKTIKNYIIFYNIL